MDIIIFLAIGAAAGWLAGTLMKSGSSDVIRNVVLGVIGAFVGGFLFKLLGLSAGGGLVGSIITATVGAALVIFIASKVKK